MNSAECLAVLNFFCNFLCVILYIKIVVLISHKPRDFFFHFLNACSHAGEGSLSVYSFRRVEDYFLPRMIQEITGQVK